MNKYFSEFYFSSLGIIFLYLGIRVFTDRVRNTFNMGIIDFGPYHQQIGIFIVLFGIFILVTCTSVFRKKKR